MSIKACYALLEEQDWDTPKDLIYKKPRDKKDDIRTAQKIILETKEENGQMSFYTAKKTIIRVCALTFSPVSLLAPFYGIATFFGLVDQMNPSSTSFDELTFKRNKNRLSQLSDNLIFSPSEEDQHALLDKCSSTALYGSCLANSLLSEKYNFFGMRRLPFLLIGTSSIALSLWTFRSQAQRNQALICEAERVLERLHE